MTPAHTTKWCEAADLDATDQKPMIFRSDIPLTIVTRVFNLVLDPPGNVVILTHRDELYISATLGYHMRYEPNYKATFGGGRPVYTRHDALQLQGLPEFFRGLIHWRQGAATRSLDCRLTFDRNRATRQGPNPFQDQPVETFCTIIDTLPTTEENMRLLQQWKQVSRGWHSHIESYSGPNNHWQHNLRGDFRAWWQTLYHRATAIARNDRDPRPSAQREEMAILLKDLCTTLETHSYSRALTGGVAVIILILTRPNTNFRETLGHLYPRTSNPFKQERILLQSLLSAGLLRHGLALTPWHSSRTGSRYIPHDVPDERYIDILP